ncbi:hypothetical protein Ptr902_08443 [Pyrenophora tritici-repentis]|nr:hypothetical protein L13192_04452 [Pyrenophora tritici-repentis]KAI2480262.1 hypothetical protein Ptr902_08443 [Pyrenophora tritici-repentis]
MNRLVDLLELLETVIVKVDTGPSMLVTQGGIVACSTAINQIRSKVGDVNPAGGSELGAGMKRLAKRITFPFKESDVKYWKTVISDIQQSLQTALHALQIDQMRLYYDRIHMSLAQYSHANISTQQTMLAHQTDQHTEHTQFLRASVQMNNQQYGSLQADMDNLKQTLGLTVTDLSHVRTLPEILTVLRRLVRSPRKIC